LANDYATFRDEAWADRMGQLVRQSDPWHHLLSVRGDADFRFFASPWADLALYQAWDEAGGYGFMLERRRNQASTGRPIPQVNEQYGFEEQLAPGQTERARTAETRRRLAWQIAMAGGYQTTGERATSGTGRGADTGGGWLNGRGDDSMILLRSLAHLVHFFTQLEWWKLEPHPELAGEGSLCLAEPGRCYVVYQPQGGPATVALAAGTYRAAWFNPRSRKYTPLPPVQATRWTSPAPPGPEDWVLLLRR